MENLDRLIHKCLLWIIAILIFAMMCVTFSQVIFRYVVGQSLSWSEEAGRYLFVWIAFLGMAAAFQSKAHVALDLLEKALPGKAARFLSILNTLLVGVVGLGLVVGGISLIKFGINQRSAAIGLPMYTVYSVIPAGGAMLLYFALRQSWIGWRSRGDAK